MISSIIQIFLLKLKLIPIWMSKKRDDKESMIFFNEAKPKIFQNN